MEVCVDPPKCLDRKLGHRMAELHERRRSLQALLSTRLAELRHICLQEAELTGAVPKDFPMEAGEKNPSVRRRGGVSRHGNRKCRAEEEDGQRSKTKKTLFSGALKKHSDPEHNGQTHHGKRTVHRGCHTDDAVRSDSSSTSNSTGHDHDVSQCRPLLLSAGSPVQVFYQNTSRRNSALTRTDHPEPPQTHRPLPLRPSHAPPVSIHPPRTRSQDSSSSTTPSDPPALEGGVNAARHSNSSDVLLERLNPLEEDSGPQQGGLRVNGLHGSRGTKNQTRASNGLIEGTGRGGGYSEVLLDYVWVKQQQQQQLQRQQTNRQPITSLHQQLCNGYSSHKAPPTSHAHPGEQRRITVTRTKSCGPFLPVQPDTNNPLSAIQPDPHPHLLPPRAPQPAPTQDAQLEEATRSLHKALALEGLRDWYLRNTIGSTHRNQARGKAGDGVKGQISSRRRTTGVIQQSIYEAKTSHKLSHSATYHGELGRCTASSVYNDAVPPNKQEVPLRDMTVDQPSPGTLV